MVKLPIPTVHAAACSSPFAGRRLGASPLLPKGRAVLASPPPRRRAPCLHRCAVLLIAPLAMAGCHAAEPTWSGYAYDNVLRNDPPHVTPGFTSVEACLAAMRPLRRASPLAGSACARACPVGDDVLADCKDVHI